MVFVRIGDMVERLPGTRLFGTMSLSSKTS